MIVKIIPPPLLPESEFVFIETLFQSNVRPVVRLNYAFLVYGALERWKAMSPPEWCQVTQTRAVHKKRYSLDFKIQDMQASRTDHIVQVHVALAQSQILRPVGMGRHHDRQILMRLAWMIVTHQFKYCKEIFLNLLRYSTLQYSNHRLLIRLYVR